MKSTVKVAADREYDQTKTVFPAEVARGVHIEHVPSLQALKLFHLMIAKAGGRMADAVSHDFRLSEIRKIDGMRNHDRASLVPLFTELRNATIVHDDKAKKRLTIGGLVDEAQIDYRDEVGGDLLVSWEFSKTFQRMARESNHWAILDRQAVFHLTSKYSVLLYQHIASLQNLRHTTSKRFTVDELRALFGVPAGKVERFATFNQRVLKPAVDEINSDITRFDLEVTYHKRGRTVAVVEIEWLVKDDLGKVSAELDRPKAGRRARRDGSAETPVLEFPVSGSVKGTKFEQIARDHAPKIEGRHVPDLLTLSADFRSWCAGKSISFDGPSIEKTFTGWAKKYHPR